METIAGSSVIIQAIVYGIGLGLIVFLSGMILNGIAKIFNIKINPKNPDKEE
jgi:hypothetical protein